MACYVPIKKRKDSKVTMRFLVLSNNFTTDHNHLEIQAHDSRGDKMWKIYFNPCKHHFILNISLFLRSPATSMNSNKHLYVADLAQNGYSLRELEGRVRIGRQYK